MDYTTCGYLWTMLKIDLLVRVMSQTGVTNVESF